MKTITLPHEITYSTKTDVSVDVLVKSLQANEILIRESVGLLNKLFKNLEITHVDVKVSELRHNSPLKEIFAAAMVVAYQDELKEEVPDLIKSLTGVDIPENADTLVTVLVVVSAVYIISAVTKKMFPSKENDALQKELKGKLAELSDITGKSIDDINTALESRLSITKSKTLYDKATDFFLPSKTSSNAPILYPNGVLVGSEAIRQIPTKVEFMELQKNEVYELENIDIEIFRADRSSNNAGWLCVVKDVSKKKKRLLLFPEISPDSLFGVHNIRGNIVVVSERKNNGDMKLKEYHLKKVTESY